MAKPLTNRQLADVFQSQADIFAKLAKSQRTAAKALPQGGTAIDTQLQSALAAYDLCIRYEFSSEGMQTQTDQYTQAANDAGEP